MFAMPATVDERNLARCIDAPQSCVFLSTYDEAYATKLLNRVIGERLITALAWSFARGVYAPHNKTIEPIGEHKPASAAIAYMLTVTPAPEVVILYDALDHLPDPRLLRVLRDLASTMRERGGTLVLVDQNTTMPDVLSHIAMPVTLSLPDEAELRQLVKDVAKRVHSQRPTNVRLTQGAMRTIVRNLRGLDRTQAELVLLDAIAEGGGLNDTDVNTVLARKREMLQHGGLLEYVESPVNLDDIAGLNRLKSWLKQRHLGESEEATAFGLTPPRGILMLGVPGSGKSLCAKAVASAWGLPLLRLDPSALYDRYVGESERRLRDALNQAAAMSPIVLWIDEIEKGFASAASQSNDGGLSQRMFGTLLTWMQEHREPVFLIATANNIKALPPELLRKGRFDEIFFVDVPTAEVRKAIFEIHLRKRGCDVKTYEVKRLAAAAEGYTGAEIEQAVVSAMHAAFVHRRRPTMDDLLTAIAGSPPLTVTMREDIAHLRQWAINRCVPADDV